MTAGADRAEASADRADAGVDLPRRLHAAVGSLAASAMSRLDERLPWFTALGPQERSWVGLVAQAGIGAFVAWYRSRPAPGVSGLAGTGAGTGGTGAGAASGVSADVFGTAPRELTRVVSLQQTLDLVRTVVDVVEEHVPSLARPDEQTELREAVLRYSREVAFSAASVYAKAAEARGAWDARLEALVVDALVRGEPDEALASRVPALGWPDDARVAAVVGTRPGGGTESALADLRRAARAVGDDALIGVQGPRVLLVLGAIDPWAAAVTLAPRFGPGPVVVGPTVIGLAGASRSARAATTGLVAARAWPEAPRPVAAEDLLPERVLAGDAGARRALADRVHAPLAAANPALAETLRAYLATGRSLEATARTLFVHPNTVRYRLRRVTEVTGWDPTTPREAFVLQVGLVVGALAARPTAVAPL